MQCEAIGTSDVELQFANGNDDTEFENLMTQIANCTAHGCTQRRMEDMQSSDDRDKKASVDEEISRCPVTPLKLEILGREQDGCTNAQRLPAFVRNLTPVVETLLEQLTAESHMRSVGHKTLPNGAIFEKLQPWTRLGGPMLLVTGVCILEWYCNFLS